MKVFISYAWEEKNNDAVIDLSNRLTAEGFDILLDKGLMQKEPSPQLKIMMHNYIVEADKVIVLLSKSYKERICNPNSGVAFEFGLILTDMTNNRSKYILASLNEFKDVKTIAPLAFQSCYIYDLSRSDGYLLLNDMLCGKHFYKVDGTKEKIDISPTFLEETYNYFLSYPESCYFNYLGKAGEAYATITRENVKLGNWNPQNGLDRFAIHCIAEAAKNMYDNCWTIKKSIDELAYDIEMQIEEYLLWRRKKASGAYQ